MTTVSRVARRFAVVPFTAIASLWSMSTADPGPTHALERVAERPTSATNESVDAAVAAPSQRPLRKVLLPQARVTPAISRAARDFLDRPIVSEAVRDIDGRAYAFAVEPHYHSPESGLRPIGWHKGVTVYAME
jgi:hypothetical protein